MRVLAGALASYVPSRIVARLVGGDPCAPFTECFPAALLFADISGSTALAEQLATMGPAGAEELSRLLNAHLGPLIDVVIAHGGDVVKFAGDGLFALWPDTVGDLGVVARRAAQCALAVQETLRRLRPSNGPRVSMRIGVGAGEVVGMAVGVADSCMEYVVLGAPIADTCRAEELAQPGEVMLTANAWGAVRATSIGAQLPFGGARLDRLRSAPPPQALAPLSVDAVDVTRLRAYAPPAIVARLSARQDEWLAELRHVTMLFARLPDWSTGSLTNAQQQMAAIASVMARYQGTIARIGMDENGPVAQLAFGLPPLAHEDDPVRGVHAALELQAALRARGVEAHIGIATGRAFCGAVGSGRRREYATVGDVVNVAARLMQAADDGILCDATTAAACGEHLAFDALASIPVRGKAEPVAIYRPRGSRGVQPRPRPDLVGRANERAQLRQRVHALITAGTGGVVLIEGEAGIGKSRLAMELRAQAQTVGVIALLGSSEAIEMSTAYHAWRPVVAQLFDFDTLPDERMTRRAHVLARLDAESDSDDPLPSLLQLAPLLNAVVPLDIPENALTAQMSSEARADNLHEFLVTLLQRAAQRRPLLLVFEDAHWMDSASWAVTLLASQRVAHLLLVVVTRPPGDPPPPEYRRLAQAPETQHVVLDMLSPQDTLALICQRLGVASVPTPVAELIRERAGGHPFFVEELSAALLEAGVITISGGECRIALEARELQQLALPRTLYGAITSRLDRLTPRQQLTAKVASVLGRNFLFETLRGVHPIAADTPYVADDLAVLERLDLIRTDTSTPEPAYFFKHAITQEVVYDLLAFTQRRQLHRAAAEWYERTHTADHAPLAALLAHHWSRALDAQQPALLEKAVGALEYAGEQAVRNYAHREAVRFFDDALRLQSPPAAATAPAYRRGHWERQLGEAHYRLGRATAAQDHLQAALALLDQGVPSTSAGFVVRVIGEAMRQLAHRFLPRLFVGRGRAGRRDTLLEAARAYELLGLVWFMMMKSLPALLANLRSLNLAEAVGPSAEMASGCAMIALFGGMFFGPRVADRYFQLGLAIARQVDDPYCLGRLLQSQGFYYTGQARWTEAEAALDEARMTFAHLGDTRWQEMAALALGNTHQMHRRYTDSLPLYAMAERTSVQRGDVQARAWSAIGAGGTLQALGRSDEALQTYDEMASWLAHSLEHLSDRGSEFSVCAIRALVRLRRGEWDLARQEADKARHISAQAPVLIYYALPGYTGLAEVSLRLWERNRGDATAARQARLAVAGLRKFARFFPIGQPQAWVWQGVYHWLAGRTAKARTAWQRGVAAAERLDMRYDEGLAHYEIGRHLPAGDAVRTQHLERACALFDQVGARYDLQCARAALSAEV